MKKFIIIATLLALFTLPSFAGDSTGLITTATDTAISVISKDSAAVTNAPAIPTTTQEPGLRFLLSWGIWILLMGLKLLPNIEKVYSGILKLNSPILNRWISSCSKFMTRVYWTGYISITIILTAFPYLHAGLLKDFIWALYLFLVGIIGLSIFTTNKQELLK